MKKILGFVLAAVMTVNLQMGVLAYDSAVTAVGDTGKIPVRITSQDYVFNVTVPTSFDIAVNSNGEVVAAPSVKVINNSIAGVAVTALTIEPAGDNDDDVKWTLVGYEAENIAENQIAMAFTPSGGLMRMIATVTPEEGHERDAQQLISNTYSQDWRMGSVNSGNNQIEIAYNAKLNANSVKGADNTVAANIILTVGWSS